MQKAPRTGGFVLPQTGQLGLLSVMMMVVLVRMVVVGKCRRGHSQQNGRAQNDG